MGVNHPAMANGHHCSGDFHAGKCSSLVLHHQGSPFPARDRRIAMAEGADYLLAAVRKVTKKHVVLAGSAAAPGSTGD